MKNTFKALSHAAVGAVLFAAVQLQAVQVQASSTFTPFSPFTISGSGVGGLLTTNAATNTVYSAQTLALNNSFILAEFYASDYAVSNGITAAAGDTLAIVNYYIPFQSSVIVGYTKLLSGRKIAIYGTNSLVAPWGSAVYASDIVILNSKGQVKADLSRATVANQFFDNTFAWNPTWTFNGTMLASANEPATKTEQGEASITFNFSFGGTQETINFKFHGSGNFTYINNPSLNNPPYYGILVLNGGGIANFSNPTYATWENQTVIFKATATVPYLTNQED
jgi:hypothetical protein